MPLRDSWLYIENQMFRPSTTSFATFLPILSENSRANNLSCPTAGCTAKPLSDKPSLQRHLNNNRCTMAEFLLWGCFIRGKILFNKSQDRLDVLKIMHVCNVNNGRMPKSIKRMPVEINHQKSMKNHKCHWADGIPRFRVSDKS